VIGKEIDVVLRLFTLMGTIQKPIRCYFTKEKRIVLIPGFTDVINRDIFELICRFLTFAYNDRNSIYQGG
jgi:hypothetical protein